MSPNVIWDKIKPFLPYVWPALGIAVVLIVLHYVFPNERVVEKLVTKEVVKEVYKEDTRIDELMKMVSSLQRKVDEQKTSQVKESYRKWAHENVNTDGSIVRDSGEERNIDSVVQETKVVTEVKVVEVTKEVVVTQTVVKEVEKRVEVTKEKIVEKGKSQWHLNALVGLQPQFKPVPGVASYAVGATVERRIIGPFFMGVWGMGTTAGAGMGGLSVGFDL